MTPTAREVRESHEIERLVEGLRRSPHAAQLEENEPEPVVGGGIRVGQVEVFEGKNPDKPYIRDAITKRVMRGSGRPAGANDSALVSKMSAAAETYKQALENLLPMFPDERSRHSFTQLVDSLMAGIIGSPVAINCPHPGCEKKHAYYPKPDTSAGFKMVELLVGKAAQQINITSREEKLVKVLEQRTLDVTIHGIDVVDAADRTALIEGFGYTVHELPPPEPGGVGAPTATAK